MRFKLLPKAIALVLTICMVLMPMINIFAQQTTQDDANEITVSDIKIKLLMELGFFESDKLNFSKPVNRGEFARFATSIANINIPDEKVVESKFSDVKKTNKNIAYIEMASEYGYMGSTGENMFFPERDITVTEAVVAIVRILGYDDYAQSLGGFPTGYLQVATRQRLLAGVKDIAQTPNLADIINICYNALHTDVYSLVTLGAYKEYKSIKGVNALSEFHQIYSDYGIITANSYTSMATESLVCQDNEIEIEKVLYEVKDDSFDQYIGYNVLFYYKENTKNDIKNIITLAPKDDNVVSIDVQDINLPLMDNVITSYSETGRKLKHNLTAGFTFILNNRVVLQRTMADLEIEDGTLTLIDNDGDGVYDVVTAQRIETMEVQAVDAIDFIIYGSKINIVMNPYDEGTFMSFERLDKFGEVFKIDIDEIKTGDVLTVYRSNDNQYVKGFLTDVAKNGTLVEIAEENIKITVGKESLWYDLTSNVDLNELKVGMNIRFIADIYGRIGSIITAIDNLGYQYGYIFKGEKAKDLMSEYEFFMITSDGIKIIPSKAKIVLDGIKNQPITHSSLFNQSEGFIRQAIRFKQNVKGEIIAIDTSNSITQNPDDSLNLVVKSGSKKYYGGLGSFNNESIISASTSVFKVPATALAREEIENYSGNFEPTSEGTYTVDLYDLNEYMEWGLVVVYTDQSDKRPVIDSAGYYKIGVVTKLSQAITEDGDIAIRTKLYYNGNIVTYDFDPEQFKSVDLEFGDVIRFEINSKGNIGTWDYEFDYNTQAPARPTVGYFHMTYGKIFNKSKNHFTIITTADNPNMLEADEHKRVLPSKGSFCIVDFDTKTVRPATYDNVASGDYVYTKVYKHSNLYNGIIYKTSGRSE